MCSKILDSVAPSKFKSVEQRAEPQLNDAPVHLEDSARKLNVNGGKINC